MKQERPNIIVLIGLLILSIGVTFFEGIYKGIQALLTGNVSPLRQTRLLRIWHWTLLDGPKQFWHNPTWYHAARSLGTLIEVLVYPKKNEKREIEQKYTRGTHETTNNPH